MTFLCFSVNSSLLRCGAFRSQKPVRVHTTFVLFRDPFRLDKSLYVRLPIVFFVFVTPSSAIFFLFCQVFLKEQGQDMLRGAMRGVYHRKAALIQVGACWVQFFFSVFYSAMLNSFKQIT